MKTTVKTKKDFPILFNGKKYYKSNCSQMFLIYYGGKESLADDCSVYAGDGMRILPNGKFVNE